MNSLERICLCSVASNAGCYEVSDFKALNVYILQQLVSYLGAYQLNRLHDVFVDAGVEVERVWKSHLALHWNSVCDFPASVFNSDNVRGNGKEPRRVYLERLFQKIIGNLDSGSDEPTYVTNLKRLPRCCHGICFQCLDSTALDNNILQTELAQYAIHVRVLSVSAVSPVIPFLLKETNLLRILQGVVRRLDMHRIHAGNVAPALELVRLLVQEGSVSEFSLFNSCIYSSLLVSLLRFVSGQLTVDHTGALPAEHPAAAVETKRSLDDDEASTSTGVIEQQDRKGSEGCDDVDIPHTTMTVDDSRKLTGPNKKSQKSLQASKGSVISDSNPDDDLYDIALTTSASNVNRSRSVLCSLIPGDLCSLCSENDSNGAAIIPTGCNNPSSNERNSSALHLRNSQSECGTALSNSKASSSVGSGSLTRCSVSPPRSCTSFTLGHFFGYDTHWVLFRMLRNWTALQKLALFEIEDHCSGRSCLCHQVDYGEYPTVHELITDYAVKDEMDVYVHFLYRSIQGCSQLTHFVTYETYFGVNFDRIIVCALLTKQNDDPMEEVKMILKPGDSAYYGTYPPSTAPTRTAPLFDSPFPEEEFFGTVCLHFYESDITDVATSELIMSWIRWDRALRCLHLPRFRDSSYLTRALKILEWNQRIVELHLNTHTFDTTSASALVSVLYSCHLLLKLDLDDCGLSKTLIDGKSFVEAIATHPSLTELTLKQNHLEDVGCDLLKAICLRNACFKSLDLSFNRIEGKLLFDTCQEVQTVLRKKHRSRFPLSELYLSGNIFHLEWRNRLVETLMDCVDVFVAQDPNLGNPAGSLADHMSQM